MKVARVQVRLTAEMKAHLDARCAKTGSSPSEYVRWLIQKDIEKDARKYVTKGLEEREG